MRTSAAENIQIHFKIQQVKIQTVLSQDNHQDYLPFRDTYGKILKYNCIIVWPLINICITNKHVKYIEKYSNDSNDTCTKSKKNFAIKMKLSKISTSGFI